MIALIAFGANLGSPLITLQNLNQLLPSYNIHPTEFSHAYQTQALANTPQPDYINAVFIAITQLSPSQLLQQTQKLETRFKRTRNPNNQYAPRTIDLDLLLLDNLTLNQINLIIPHPRMHLRRFVLEPASEIAPNWIHPTTNKTIKELYMKCNDPLRVEKIPNSRIPLQ